MTKGEAMAARETMRASLTNVIRHAKSSCGASDLRRAAGQMGILAAGKILVPPDHHGFPMVCDSALFEANEHGIRPIDRFLKGPAQNLPEAERKIAAQTAAGRPGALPAGRTWKLTVSGHRRPSEAGWLRFRPGNGGTRRSAPRDRGRAR